MRKTFLLLAAFLPTLASAQTFNFDMTQEQPVFSESAGYGYDILPAPTKKGNMPYYFSVNVPDGNYKVRVEIGSKKKAGK